LIVEVQVFWIPDRAVLVRNDRKRIFVLMIKQPPDAKDHDNTVHVASVDYPLIADGTAFNHNGVHAAAVRAYKKKMGTFSAGSILQIEPLILTRSKCK
jgi:hypothetical protein